MKSSIVRLAAIATLVIALTAGCTPDPAPTPSPTGFTSEEEAFAAAEKTYRAYVDALNQVDLSDPQTFEAVYQWTTGDANGADRKSFTQMHADGLTVKGVTRASLVQAHSNGASNGSITELAVCQDVSDVTLIDAQGKSASSPDRIDVQSLLISLARSSDSATGWLITTFSAREGAPECTS